MDTWIKLYDSSAALLKQVITESSIAIRDIRYADLFNLNRYLKAANEFVKPSLDLKWVARFYRDNCDQTANQRDHSDVMFRALDERDQFLDVHSKISHLYGLGFYAINSYNRV